MLGPVVRSRSWLWLLTGIGLLASMLASATPVAADANNPDIDNPALYSACVGPALESVDLGDVAGTRYEQAVNCLAHYGITQGTAAGFFEPLRPMKRWQMALFLTRLAGPAGVVLRGGSSQGFTDIGDLSRSVQTAINQLAEIDITKGKASRSGDKIFDPSGTVTRAQMALFLDRFLQKATLGPGAAGSTGYPQVTFNITSIEGDDNVFIDIEDLVLEAYNAVRRLYELGITTGATENEYRGRDVVTRGQMALFLTRMMAHTNARPAGVTLQADKGAAFGETVRLVASVRDANQRVSNAAWVDVFGLPTANRVADAFNSAGGCNVGAIGVAAVSGDNTSCVVSAGDGRTDARGNIVDTYVVRESATIYAWQGSLGAEFRRETSNAAQLEVKVSAAARGATVTTNLSAGATDVQFGSTVVFTVQLVDANGRAVAQPDRTVLVRIDKVQDVGNQSHITQNFKTDADGRFTLSETIADPNPGRLNTGDRVEVTVSVVASGGLVGNPSSRVVWSDGDAITIGLSVSFPGGIYQVARDGACNTVVASIRDQFANPTAGKKVTFTSDDTEGLGKLMSPNNEQTTNNSGEARFRYCRDSTTSGKETITVTAEDITDSKSEDFYWVEQCTDTDCDVSDAPVALVDTASNVIIYDAGSGSYKQITYRTGDHLTFNNVPTDFLQFENNYAKHKADNPTDTYTVTVAQYSSSSARDRQPSVITLNPVAASS